MSRLMMTSIEPSEIFMPTIEQWLALAEALHDEDDLCNANSYDPFDKCPTREYDIEVAVKMLVALHKVGWRLVHDPGGTVGMGL